MLLVSEVATLSLHNPRAFREGAADLDMNVSTETGDTPQQPSQQGSVTVRSPLPSVFYKSLNDSQRRMIMQQLDAWEEPVLNKKKPVSRLSCFR